MREGMNHLLRTQDFTELESALRAADGHLEMNAPEEALGELRRAQIRLIKSPRHVFISCNLRYLKFICPSLPRNKSYKPDFTQRVVTILIDS